MSKSSVLSDPELIAAVRNGDISAYAGLYSRHADRAYRLAGLLTQDPDDRQRLVSDSFAAVRMTLLGEGGPAVIFRPYLLNTVRDVHYDLLRRRRGLWVRSDPPSRQPLAGLIGPLAAQVPTGSLVAEAVRRLPARWQLVLWHVDVEREPPALVGPIVGLLPPDVPILAARAHARLRSAYLQEMARHAGTAECSWAAKRLAAGVAQQPHDPDQQRLNAHLSRCRPCRQRSAEFSRLETGLHELLGPLVLGSLAEAYRAGGSEAASRKPAGRPFSRRRRSGHHAPRGGLISAAVAAAATVVVLAGVDLGSPVPAPMAAGESRAAGADVTVSLAGTLVRGSRTQLQVRVANGGPASSGTVTLLLTLPAGASLGGTVPGRWACSGRTRTLVCSHPPLGPGSRTAVLVLVSLQRTAPPGGRAAAVVSPAVADPAGRNNRAETSVSQPG